LYLCKYTFVLLNNPSSCVVLKLPVPRSAVDTFPKNLCEALRQALPSKWSRVAPAAGSVTIRPLREPPLGMEGRNLSHTSNEVLAETVRLTSGRGGGAELSLGMDADDVRSTVAEVKGSRATLGADE
jgi:hypothetical protein